MPRVQTQKARKDYPEQGIKKGDTYYSWKFRYGGEYKSKTPPKPSQLTQSKWAAVYAAREMIEEWDERSSADDLATLISDAAGTVDECASEYEESAEAMGGAGEQMREWAEQLQSLSSELEDLQSRAADIEEPSDTEDAAEASPEPATPPEPSPDDVCLGMRGCLHKRSAHHAPGKDGKACVSFCRCFGFQEKPVKEDHTGETAQDIYDEVMGLDWDPQ